MQHTNPKLIYHLRQHAKALRLETLDHLYADGQGLQQDLAVLQRQGLVSVVNRNVLWRGT